MADPKYVRDFIEQMTPYAVAVGDQYGIDPITIITQAAVETGWGREVAGNNYFGVKSHGKPGGQNITTHEEVNGKRVKVQDNFRSYGSLGESVADYGRFLSENPRYTEALKETGRSELKGIANAGYATSSDYKDLTNNVAGMVERNIRPLPPGSLPEVGTLTDTVPPRTVAPVTPSIDLAQMRRTNIPSQLMPDTFASLASGRTKGQTRAADLGLTEKTAATPYLKRNGDVLDPAGVVLGKEMVTQLPGTRKAVPQSTIERTALPRFSPDYISQSLQKVASTNPTRLPPVPPSTLGQPPSTRVVQSVPVTPPAAPKPLPRVTVSTPSTVPQRMAAQDIGNVPRAATPPPTQTAFVPEARYIEPRNVSRATPLNVPGAPNGTFMADKGQERLAPVGLSVADTQLARLVAPLPAIRPATFAQAVPGPMPPYNDVGTALAIRPMPSLPLVRPSFLQQRPVAAQQRAPLRITVSGAQVRQPPAQVRRAAPPPLPAAALYALLNSGRGSINNSDAANRVNGSSTRGSGGARSLLD